MIKYYKIIIRRILLFILGKRILTDYELKKIWENAKTICIICASGIGDALMATPLIEEIKKQKPAARLILGCTENTFAVFQENPNIELILTYLSKRKGILLFLLFLLKIRKEKVDVLFMAQPSNTIRHSLIAAFSNAKLRCKHSYDYQETPERDYLFVYDILLPNQSSFHRVEMNLNFLRYFGEDVRPQTIFPRFYVSESMKEKIRIILSSLSINGSLHPLIALHPGGGRLNKRWEADNYAKLARELIRKSFMICLVGGKDEVDLNREIEKKINSDKVLNRTGKYPLQETGALLSKCYCLISNDSGIMHLGTAVHVPVIALFGPTDSRHIGPYSPLAEVITNPGGLQKVTVNQVIESLNRIGTNKSFPN